MVAGWTGRMRLRLRRRAAAGTDAWKKKNPLHPPTHTQREREDDHAHTTVAGPPKRPARASTFLHAPPPDVQSPVLTGLPPGGTGDVLDKAAGSDPHPSSSSSASSRRAPRPGTHHHHQHPPPPPTAAARAPQQRMRCLVVHKTAPGLEGQSRPPVLPSKEKRLRTL